ncbi:hypothetical protein GCM10010493_35450 [Streptomyces lavendulae subsp. grasserius]
MVEMHDAGVHHLVTVVAPRAPTVLAQRFDTRTKWSLGRECEWARRGQPVSVS